MTARLGGERDLIMALQPDIFSLGENQLQTGEPVREKRGWPLTAARVGDNTIFLGANYENH